MESETITQIETVIEVELPDYKTRTIQPDERDLILLIIDESVRIGRNCDFNYSLINDINHLAIQRTTYIEKTVKQKKELFAKLDQRSYTYSRILNTAKLALRTLQDDGVYNYYSAELLYKFIQLEEIFGERNLKSVGVKYIEDEQRVINQKKSNLVQPVVQVDEDGEPVYIPQGISGKKLDRYKKKLHEQEETSSMLKEMNFEDETDTLKSLNFK